MEYKKHSKGIKTTVSELESLSIELGVRGVSRVDEQDLWDTGAERLALVTMFWWHDVSMKLSLTKSTDNHGTSTK